MKTINPFFSPKKFFFTGAKAIVYLTAALYLIAFGFFGVNIYGSIDVWIPIERGLLLMIGLTFGAMAFDNFFQFFKQYIGLRRK